MGLSLDLTGQRFGDLTAIRIVGRNDQGRNIWLCACDCGNETRVQSSKLKNSHTKSCGCKKYEAIRNYANSLFVDLTSQRFGRLTVMEQVPHEKKEVTKWRCICDCGKETIVIGHSLKTGNTQSCGCLNKETTTKTHGHTVGGKFTPEYSSWAAMLTRCTNPNSMHYYRYGGRGIKVSERWLHSFETFLEDMGSRPKGRYSIERKNNEGNYEPGNCFWATDRQQTRNRGLFKNNKAGVKGIFFENSTEKWVASIGVDGKQLHLGRFVDIESAKEARLTAEQKYWKPS